MYASGEDELERALADAKRRHRPQREPKRIGDAVNRLMARKGYAQVQEAVQYSAIWQQVAGDQLARTSRVGRLHRGVLEIVVQNSAALQEVTFLKQKLLRQLQAATENKNLRDLRFKVGEID